MHPQRATGPFRYESYDVDPGTATLTCRYSLGSHQFSEQFVFDDAEDARWDDPAVAEAARLVFLFAGVSYYKTGAPTQIEVGDWARTRAEHHFLRSFYLHGLGEFAHRNGIDLRELGLGGIVLPAPPPSPPLANTGRPLVPFGGGIDSIVTVEAVRASHPDTELFVMSRAGDRFDAIETPAAVTGLPIRRVGRTIDSQLLRSAELGFLNGHVPVTGILSSVAVMAAVLAGRDAVVMSNEWSASFGNATVDGVTVNHQWSKSLEFETGFRSLLAGTGAELPDYFSFLRPYSELWVGRRFAALAQYLPVFRSCNCAFTLDPAKRLDHWCGRCDKCCFIDLILAPFVPADELAAVFGGREPLADVALRHQFRTLLGLTDDDKPFECVGDVEECRVAAVVAADRPDRAATALLTELARDAAAASPGVDLRRAAHDLLEPMGPHHIPDDYAPHDQLV
jgi:hypothetical protein